MELKEGAVVSIPCRHCGTLIATTLVGRAQSIECPKSIRTIGVRTVDGFRVRTEPG